MILVIIKECNMKNTLLFVMLFLSVLAFNASATCGSITLQTTTTDLGNTIVQRDTAVGSVLNTIITPSAGDYGKNCDDGIDTFGLYLDYSSTISSMGGVTYETNVPGVGIRLYNGGTSGSAFTNPQNIITNHQSGNWAWDGGTLQLIKTGDIKSGSLKSGTIGTVRLLGFDTAYHDGVYITTTGGTVTVLACSISTPKLTFPIGNVSASEFGNTIGFIPAEMNTQNLGLNCDADANINVELSGTQNPDVSDTSVLALSGQGTAGVASGLGVQLLYNGVPLENNKNIVMKKSEGGQEMLPITARYYQTKTAVMPGDASTSATLILTYQ